MIPQAARVRTFPAWISTPAQALRLCGTEWASEPPPNPPMKISQFTAVAASCLALSMITSNRTHAQATSSPAVPVGWLSASPGMVRAGTNPALKWSISYPSKVVDYVEVDDSVVIPKETLDYEVRVLGAGVTSSNANGSNLTFVPTEALFSVAGATYQRIFYGTNYDVKPSKVVASGKVKKDQPLCFGGRYYYDRSWSTFYHSTSGTNNVRTLVNGDSPPTTYALHTAPTLENFIKPYLDGSGRVAIGPMDVIVFMELTHTDNQSTQMGYDCQDMVLLVTFKTKK